MNPGLGGLSLSIGCKSNFFFILLSLSFLFLIYYFVFYFFSDFVYFMYNLFIVVFMTNFGHLSEGVLILLQESKKFRSRLTQ